MSSRRQECQNHESHAGALLQHTNERTPRPAKLDRSANSRDGEGMTWLVTGATMQGIPRIVATRLVGLTVKTRCPNLVKSVLT